MFALMVCGVLFFREYHLGNALSSCVVTVFVEISVTIKCCRTCIDYFEHNHRPNMARKHMAHCVDMPYVSRYDTMQCALGSILIRNDCQDIYFTRFVMA